MSSNDMVIAVALVEPQYEVNVGHVARLLKNFGHLKMYFINPHFNAEEAIRFSTHGKDILASSKVISLPKLKTKFDVLVGTTAIQSTSKLNVFRESINANQLAQAIKLTGSNKDFCILLGRESSGLTNEELNQCDLVVVIDTKTDHNTLNISHALAIILYEISKTIKPLPPANSKKAKEYASRKEITLLERYVEKLARKSGYDKHKRPLLNSSLRRVVGRSMPTSKEVMLLVSLMRKSVMAIERSKATGRQRHFGFEVKHQRS